MSIGTELPSSLMFWRNHHELFSSTIGWRVHIFGAEYLILGLQTEKDRLQEGEQAGYLVSQCWWLKTAALGPGFHVLCAQGCGGRGVVPRSTSGKGTGRQASAEWEEELFNSWSPPKLE